MPPAGWFVDADILGLYHVLKAARRSTTDDVYSGLTDDFPISVGMTDADWMSLLKGRDLAILTKDAKQRFHGAERDAIQDNGLGIFALRSRRHMNMWEMTRLVLSRWDQLEEAWDTTPRPFVYHLVRSGGLNRVL